MSLDALLSTLRFIRLHPLTQKDPMKGLGRFLAWQIGGRLVPGPVVFEFVPPARLFVQPGMTAATGNLYVGLQEFEDMAFTLHILRQGDLFADVGANVGTYTILASSVVGADCVSFEPVEDAYSWLLRNVALNGVSNKVLTVQAAVGARVETVAMSTALDTINHIIASEAPDRIGASAQVRVTTLDETFAHHSPTLIKIDVEGFETAVVDGGVNTLASSECRGLILELNGSGKKYGYNDAELHARLEAMGFESVSYLPFERRLVARRDFSPGNVIFVRDLNWASQRLRDGPPFHCRGVEV
jgi:FkbM family methyltransferase